MVPLPFMQATKGASLYMPAINKLSDLDPGVTPGLDVICDGILKGTPFIYPAETLGLAETEAA